MLTIVIPDIHQDFEKAERIIKKSGADRVIFLGDYFDALDKEKNSNRHTERTARWLKRSLKNPNRIHLRGNHDIGYESYFSLTACSGNTVAKHQIINSILTPKDWGCLKWFHIINKNYLFTHAGLGNYWFLMKRMELNTLEEHLNKESEYANAGLENRSFHWFYAAGYTRQGEFPVGGIVWCDAHEGSNEFESVNGLSQIFGHSIMNEPRIFKNGENFSICLDTQLNHCMMFEDDDVKNYRII